jgi:uncharacterized protein YodC (DUF2158 family)
MVLWQSLLTTKLYRKPAKQKQKMNEFKLGDVVYLKSGGPAMTVNRFIEHDTTSYIKYVECTWMRDDIVQAYSFEPETLVLKNTKAGHDCGCRT